MDNILTPHNFQDPSKYKYAPFFTKESEWCWLEVYKNIDNTDYIIYPQFYKDDGKPTSRPFGSINVKQLLQFQIMHKSGKIVKLDVDFLQVTEIIYFYRNIRNFDMSTNNAGNQQIRYPICGFKKKTESGDIMTYQVKLLPDGDTYLIDNIN